MGVYQGFTVFLCVFISIFNDGEGRAFPDGGSPAMNLQIDLFSPDGPLAQIGNEIAAGATQLEDQLNSGAKQLQDDLNNAANFMSQGSMEELAGVNVAGLHAGLKTNLFSKTGPLAQMGGDLAAGAAALEKDIQKEANALGESMAGAANALQANLQGGADLFTKGLQDLGSQMSASGGASLDGLFNMGGNLGMGGKDAETLSISGGLPQIDLSGLSIFGQTSGQPKGQSQESAKTITVTSGAANQNPSGRISVETNLQGGGSQVTSQQLALTPEILAEIMKKINLPDMCKGILDNPVLENFLDKALSFPGVLEEEHLALMFPGLDFREILALMSALQGLALEKAAEALPVIAGLALI